MRLPALIIASAGNGYQVLYKSKAFESLNPADMNAVCQRMDGYRFEGESSYFVTQSLGKIVVGKSTLISKAEYGDIKIKVTHCYFMNMNSFIEIVRGYRHQGAVIATFREQVRQDYDTTVEEVSFVKRPFAENTMTGNDIVDTIVSLGMTDAYKKFMFCDVLGNDAMKVLFGYFSANFISELSVLSNGEAVTNDFNVLFGAFNTVSDNRVISVHTASRGITNIGNELNAFVKSVYKNYIIEIMEHADKDDMGYLADLVSVTRIITDFENKNVISANQIIKLMDKASSIEGKMSIYGLLIEIKNGMKNAQISEVEMIEKYWAFVVYTSIVHGDKKNAALVHNVCANQKGIDRERYLGYIKEAIMLKCDETDNENLATLVLIAHEKQLDKTKLINNRYDLRMARAFMMNRLNLGARMDTVERIMYELCE